MLNAASSTFHIGQQRTMSSYAGRVWAFRNVDEWALLWAVFLGSLVLSLVASLCNPIVARDAALYLDIAGGYQRDGFAEALKRFDWPWFPIAFAELHQLTGIASELIARVLCELFTAIACVLCVDIVRRTRPDLAGWAALAVFAIPAFNIYRGDILRENGFWCFSMLAIWAMQCWMLYRRWCCLGLGVLAVALAALFRLEAVYLLAVMPVCCILSVKGGALKRTLMVALSISLVVAVSALLLWAKAQNYLPSGRFSNYVGRLDVSRVLGHFSAFAEQLAQLMPFEYARDDSAKILFAGFAAYMLLKLLNAVGVLVVPWLFGMRRSERESPWLVLDIALVGYCLILFVFLIDHLFISLRYVVFGGFLCIPRIAQGLQIMVQRWPRMKMGAVVLLVVMALAHVISTSAPKTQIRQAGIWIGANLPRDAKLYIEDNRLAYFAGWGYGTESRERDQALALTGPDAYEFFALDLKGKPEKAEAELAKQGLVPVVQFKNREGDTYAILRRVRQP
ncbi:MAG: hypothetical protein GAK43_01021 [Stenotrophomonas maltophilia]|nr:MAG: hypothetical protein GAK43_01021 [Stenotrophomonas maltophilia]